MNIHSCPLNFDSLHMHWKAVASALRLYVWFIPGDLIFNFKEIPFSVSFLF